jgi:glyoxylase-like metal-dependent hydrolase (beta-lactamase superfamily II)
MLRRSFLRKVVAVSAGGVLLRAQAAGLKVTPLRGKLYLLSGAGGNIIIQEGPDGLLMIDSGLSDSTAGILAETGKIGNGKVTLLFNTHWHTDHTGSNVVLGKQGVKIIAQENVRTRLAKGQYMEFFKRQVDPMASEGLPAQTFRDKGKIQFGGETAHYEHLPPAHTDGDAVIYFHNANVFHGGDLLFNGMYPFIDYGSAGSLTGMAHNATSILTMVHDDTVIIPGHGPVAKKSDVQEFADMLNGSLEIFTKEIKAGKTLDQLQAEKPCKAYDDKWGRGFMKPEAWIALNYSGMKSALGA